MLKIYNSLTRSKEEFIPLEANKVRMYVCGITVYDLCHVGHGRTFTCFDIIARYFKFSGYDLTFVRNITDIDDKIINRSNEANIGFNELVDSMIIEMNKDFASLNLLKPTHEPKATENIKEIITLCETLIAKDYAYVNEAGDLLFRVSKYKEYGHLSKQNIDGLKASDTIVNSETKESNLDFVLWKKSKANEPSWNSPWGLGRPGWHIECSAMSCRYLGNEFDIHGGGSDLMFPHHENEIAQSTCAHGSKYAHYWLHTGMVMVNAEKMSKSLNNFFTLRTLLEEYSPESIRYFFMSSHYRSTLDYTTDNIESAHAGLTRLYNSLRGYELVDIDSSNEYILKFKEYMDDDFNTPKALSVLFELSKEINITKQNNQQEFNKLASILVHLGGVLGILEQDPEVFLQKAKDIDSDLVESLIKERNIARANKDWAAADIVRDKLNALNIVLEDTKEGQTIWSIKKG